MMSKDLYLVLLTPCLLLAPVAPLRGGEVIQGRVIRPEGGVKSIAVSPDGRWLVTGTNEDTRLWNLQAVDPLAKCFVLRGSVGPISPDGHWLATVVNGRAIWLWNLKAEDPSAEGTESARGEANWKSLRGVAIGPNNRWLVARSGDGVMRLWNLKAKGAETKPQVLMEWLRPSLTVSADGRWLAAARRDGVVAVWDLAAGDPALPRQITKDKQLAPPVVPTDISPDGRWLITVDVVIGRSGMRRLWDLRAKDPWARAVGDLGDAEQVRNAVFTADNRRLATGGDDRRPRLYDLAATDLSRRPIVFPRHKYPAWDLAFSGNGRWLVTAGGDIRVWDMKASDPSTKSVVLKGSQGPEGFLTVAPNSRWVVTGSTHVWDLEAADPTAVHAELGPHGKGEKLFSPDSRWLVTLDEGKTARLWELKAAELWDVPDALR
jgi:WD40 repeat protein